MLALKGGVPELTEGEDSFAWPPVSGAQLIQISNGISDGLNRGQVSSAIQAFEKRLTEFFDKRFALSFNSCTSALHSAFLAMDIQPGDEVIVPALTFFGTVTPLLHLGARPIAIDCDQRGQMDLDQVVRSISSKTRAIVVTHMWGYATDVWSILEVCERHSIPIVEDIAHSPGARLRGQLLGTAGATAVCSLHGEKTLSCGEGGFLISDSKAVFDGALFRSNYNRRTRYETEEDYIFSEFSLTGYGIKQKINPIGAMIATQQLENLDVIVRKRAEYTFRLTEATKRFPFLKAIELLPSEKPSWHSLILLYDDSYYPTVPRNLLIKALKAEGLSRVDSPGANRPLSFVPLFRNPRPMFPNAEFSFSPGDFPKAEGLWSKMIQIALPGSEWEGVDGVERALIKVFEHIEDLA